MKAARLRCATGLRHVPKLLSSATADFPKTSNVTYGLRGPQPPVDGDAGEMLVSPRNQMAGRRR
jgi:hypothetical protein